MTRPAASLSLPAASQPSPPGHRSQPGTAAAATTSATCSAPLAALLADPAATTTDIVRTMLTSRKVPSRLSTRQALAAVPTSAAAEALAKTLTHVWAPSTLRDRQSLWARYNNFLTDKGLPLSDHTAALFISATDVLPSSKLAYTKSLMSLLATMRIECPILRLLAKGLRGEGALVPTHQANPITREHLLALAESFPPPDAAAVLLAWKTASRWDEISRLTTDHLIHRSDAEIVIDWMQDTKSSRLDPHRATNLTVVRGEWTDRIHRSLSTVPHARLTQITYDDLILRMTEMFPEQKYTAHSIKRGALEMATIAAAEHQVPPQTLDLLAKHKPTNPPLESTTLTYLGSKKGKAAAARLIGTGNLTRHL